MINLAKKILKLLKSPDQVHKGIVSGAIAKTNMAQCAHTHGQEMLARWHEFEVWELNNNACLSKTEDVTPTP